MVKYVWHKKVIEATQDILFTKGIIIQCHDTTSSKRFNYLYLIELTKWSYDFKIRLKNQADSTSDCVCKPL